MPSRILALPFILALIGCFLLAYYVDSSYSWYMIFPGVILGGIFALQPQIDWWWYQRFPPRLDAVARRFLLEYHDFFRRLSEEHRRKFEARVRLILQALDFKSQSEDDLPEDIRLIVAANLAHLTFGREPFRIKGADTVVVYPRPFPSPQYPEHFHASEYFAEDGVVLFSAQHLVLAFTQPTQYYNLGLHEWINAFIDKHPDIKWPECPPRLWEELTRVSGFPTEKVREWINRPDVQLLPVTVVHFLCFPEPFLKYFPELYQELNGILHVFTTGAG